jgi:hypothetical protein
MVTAALVALVAVVGVAIVEHRLLLGQQTLVVEAVALITTQQVHLAVAVS